jgi:hypothetical protein
MKEEVSLSSALKCQTQFANWEKALEKKMNAIKAEASIIDQSKEWYNEYKNSPDNTITVKIYKMISGNGYKEASEYGAHGTARFAKNNEIFNGEDFAKNTFNKTAEKNLNNSPGLILGLVDKKPLIAPYITPTSDAPNRNVFVVGAPDSGKSQSYILSNIIFEQNRSMVVTDPKGGTTRS